MPPRHQRLPTIDATLSQRERQVKDSINSSDASVPDQRRDAQMAGVASAPRLRRRWPLRGCLLQGRGGYRLGRSRWDRRLTGLAARRQIARSAKRRCRVRASSPRSEPQKVCSGLALQGVGLHQATEVTMGEQQRKAGWLARWRDRRRSRSARAADISRRVLQAERRNIDNASKYGGAGGG
jgi:hypothetical protein